MEEYPKIQTVYKRDPDNRFRTLLEGEFALPEFEYLAKNEWLFTEKIDGTNVRVGWDTECVRYAGRTDKSQLPPFLLEKLQEILPASLFQPWAAQYDAETPLALYGEGYGAKIQKGGDLYISDSVSFILFDIRLGEHWLRRHHVENIASLLHVDCVPIIGSGTLYDAVEIVRAGFDSQIGKRQAEGLVMRPVVDLSTRLGEKIIAKIKHRDFA